MAAAVEAKGQGMRITLQTLKQRILSLYSITSKSGVLFETLFLLLMVFGEEKNPQQKPTETPLKP